VNLLPLFADSNGCYNLLGEQLLDAEEALTLNLTVTVENKCGGPPNRGLFYTVEVLCAIGIAVGVGLFVYDLKERRAKK
jgi:hypothetical protein